MTDSVILSVRLASGKFEASVSVPIDAETKRFEFNDIVSRWLALTATALQHGVEELRATLKQASK